MSCDLRDTVRAWKPLLMADTVREAPHCWHRMNMMRVDASLSSSVSGDLHELHSTYLREEGCREWSEGAVVMQARVHSMQPIYPLPHSTEHAHQIVLVDVAAENALKGLGQEATLDDEALLPIQGTC